MPTISVNKVQLFNNLNINLSDEEFSNFIFDFGLEVDDIVIEENEVVYKIEIPANRYDLLCLQGLTTALAIYKDEKIFENLKLYSKKKPEKYNNIFYGFENINENELIETPVVFYHKNSQRQFIACAIIHELNLTEQNYTHFIDYQDKLHATLGRDRTITAIGTHDLNKIKFPVHYKSLKPSEIAFVPLNSSEKTKSSAQKICESYLSDSKMKNYTKILYTYDKYPVFVDNTGEILSLPPLINSEYSKIEKSTKNVFVEVTGTDFNKVNQALNCILYNFRGKGYSSVPIIGKNMDKDTINNIKQYYDHIDTTNHIQDQKNIIADGFYYKTPVLVTRKYEFKPQKINEKLGLNIETKNLPSLINKMMHYAEIKDNKIIINVFPNRPDILHECDLLEDIAISYGYNNFIRKPVDLYTVSFENSLNKFSNKLRQEIAECGYNELLTLSLLSEKDSLTASLDNKNVKLVNPKSTECEVVKNTLLPGILKSISCNQHLSIPQKVFEISDIVKVSNTTISNKRMLCAAFVGKSDNFENIIGLLSIIFKKIGFENRFKYVESDNLHIYFGQRGGYVYLDNEVVGSVGVVHPRLCDEFHIPFAISSFEVCVEQLFNKFLH
ncbi:phenylalanine-tRNA ligase, beta subunit [Edhazardia aedis USNM 41457]|uniref:phenylalanine--tRNA ligase n=1 Tax=Edhazardia aedis (strain USNM 41457) TaxID=1003232 RepID=J9D3S5_EDHAE|nr:phenylalanine-tRNA ligase, beta subunit [Edhazardia aedis USNM 41457]|eukprot:EJW02194.1 phenylalanine-tRNA ligase, beta subunit [Edhazardia aedis USNM 41457]